MRLQRTFKTLALALSLGGGFAASAAASGPILVTNGDDSGPGSFRAALMTAAEAGSPGPILIVTGGDIRINSTLAYNGTAPLTIYGNGQTVMTGEDVTLLAVTQGADLSISDLSFQGPGGFSIENRGDLDGASGKGLFVDLRDDQTGVMTLTLNGVIVSGVANHGIHVSDCSLADDCGGGSGGAGEGSPASIVVRLNNVSVSDVGNGKFDADGLRVDERNEGDIHFFSRGSSFSTVGADGVELDEGQAGHVIASSVGDSFLDNGAYCDPAILDAFMPDEDEGEFEDGARAEADIPGAVEGSPDDGCFEREVELFDSGFVAEFEIGIDLDDGIDIDEAGPGDLRAIMVGALIARNLDEGMDFDEEGEGNLLVDVWRSEAHDNNDDGFKNSEEDGGNVEGLVIGVTSRDNGGKGVVYEEADGGDLMVAVEATSTANNDDSDGTGLEIVQEDAGSGALTLRASDIADGIDADGVEVEQK